MDDWVIIPSAMLSLFTGGLLSWLTIWGFTKHYFCANVGFHFFQPNLRNIYQKIGFKAPSFEDGFLIE